MMEKKKYAMIIVILLLVLALSGMLMAQFLSGNYAVTGKKLSSWNGEYTIGVPRNWDAVDASASTALIAAQTSREDMYLLVSLDAYDYGPDMTLDIYINNYLNYVAGNSDEVSETKMLTLPETVSVDGLSGYYYEYTAPSDGIQVYLFCFAADTPDGYLSIQIACDESDADGYRETAKNIIASLRLHKEDAADSAAGTAETAEPADDYTGEEAAEDAAAQESDDGEETAEAEGNGTDEL